MIKVAEMENGKENFKLIPTTIDCPYLEVRFNLEKKVLTIIAKEKYEDFRIIPKLNDDGNLTASKTHESKYKHERLRMNSFYDYSITVRSDIERFVNLVTGLDNDLDKYFIVEPVVEKPVFDKKK